LDTGKMGNITTIGDSDDGSSSSEDENAPPQQKPNIDCCLASEKTTIGKKRKAQPADGKNQPKKTNSDASGNNAAWNDKFELLKAFKQLYGHTHVPPKTKRSEFGSLYPWLHAVKKRKDRPYIGYKQLTDHEIAALEELGLDWSTSAIEIWETHFEKLKAFQEENGHCNVPTGPDLDQETNQLALWVVDQKIRRLGACEIGWRPLIKKEIEKLESIGFQWE